MTILTATLMASALRDKILREERELFEREREEYEIIRRGHREGKERIKRGYREDTDRIKRGYGDDKERIQRG